MSPNRTTDTPAADAERAAAEFSEQRDVAAVEIDEARTPPRIGVTLDGMNTTPGVRDLLEKHNADVEYVDGGGDGLYLEFTALAPFRPCGSNAMRIHGQGSHVLTFTRESIELSGFDTGDDLQLYARPGEIRLTEE